jgi:hypothetical protein
MRFPDIKIIEEVEDQTKTILRCKIDWSDLDEHKKISTIKWWNNYMVDKLSVDEKKVLNDILNDANWDEFLYPTKYKHIYDMFEYIDIPITYYNELIHLRDLSLLEWNRSRPFDTSVREHLLSTSIKSVELYFFLLSDALLYNKELYTNINIINDELKIINGYRCNSIMYILWLFRFWKHQTGNGLVITRSLAPFVKNLFSDDFLYTLEENMRFRILNNVLTSDINISDALKIFIRTRLRDDKLNSILPSMEEYP